MLTPDLANKADGKPDIITEHAQWRSLSAGHFVPPGLDYVIGLQGQSYPTEEALWTEGRRSEGHFSLQLAKPSG